MSLLTKIMEILRFIPQKVGGAKQPGEVCWRMKVNATLFETYLQCPTKCYLRSLGETGTGNAYADWVRERKESYRRDGIQRLIEGMLPAECAVDPLTTENLKRAKWKVASKVTGEAKNLESTLDAVERVPSAGPGQPAQFVPIRLVYTHKLTRDDKLLVAFDALVFSEMLGREVSLGKIIHGDNQATVKVKTAALAKETRKLTEKIATLVSNPSPPDLILNRHCAECEFQTRCRPKAVEADDLSLFSGMKIVERARYRRKGIFTINQLSYTFRPRRLPKSAKKGAKPHYFALQALAIREKAIYINGKPQLPQTEAKVYLDIEGIPDTNFHYLIGALVVTKDREDFYSFWADDALEENGIFVQFLERVLALPDYRLFHYGHYDIAAIRHIRARVAAELHPQLDNLLKRTVNVLTLVYQHLYFPTYSYSLKDLGRLLGCERTTEQLSGPNSILWRKQWELDRNPEHKETLIRYNKEDCLALKRLCDFMANIEIAEPANAQNNFKIRKTEEMRPEDEYRFSFGEKKYGLDDLHFVNKCAYFDYQREKVYIRTDEHLKAICKPRQKTKPHHYPPNKVIHLECKKCPFCRSKEIQEKENYSRYVVDLKFSRFGAKRFIIQYINYHYACLHCGKKFISGKSKGYSYKFGRMLKCWCVYWNVQHELSLSGVCRNLIDFFDITTSGFIISRFKSLISMEYRLLYGEIHQAILRSPFVHIDETEVKLVKSKGYVWVLTTMDKVYYLYRPDREGDFLHELLKGFSGVLISDFYSAYDSLPCSQQKCLIHLIRDLDDDLLKNPLDEELKSMATDFGVLLRNIIQTVDRYGLKKFRLHKHKTTVNKFMNSVAVKEFTSEFANKYKNRFAKWGLKMFTFLDHDGVPWNNNNAEHAIKRFAKYRRSFDGYFTENSIKTHLILASIFVTCEFNNLSVLKFLLSEEMTLEGLMRIAGRKAHAIPPGDQINPTVVNPLK